VSDRAGRRRTSGRRIAIALLALATFAHCGRKTDVKPPELVAPEVVEDVQAHNGDKGIRLTWRRPTQYVDGSTMTDLGGFRIERSRDGEPFTLLAEVPVTDRERFRKTRRFRIVDTDVESKHEYRYRVRAFTLDGHTSRASNLAGLVREEPVEQMKPELPADAPP